ncbi:AraC family ligand binding domain-containing protein [Caldifermentibacillus hisashii]|jgi:AraC-like DNA-binding protein|uniref:AraC family transcriptional regulator n=1 Tax=Caldifermentibacillus hisashii TaxID=996558 RepID=UPI0030D649D0|nr:AraC family ligand binding domain-containing protein [Caldibacillus thermoamylovorans]
MEIEKLTRLNITQWKDIKLMFCGESECYPLHYYGPGTKPYTIIHFILKGKGIFKIDDTTYSLKKGDLFLIQPNQMVFYQADKDDPWTYAWIGIDGDLVDSILKRIGLSYPLVTRTLSIESFTEIKRILKELIESKKNNQTSDLYIIGNLLILLSLIEKDLDFKYNLKDKENKSLTYADSYVERAIAIIEKSYYRDLKINEIAEALSINRSYLSQVFKEKTGYTLKEYITDFRISRCEELLFSTNWSIEKVGKSVGFKSGSYFSKVFKKKYGMSPSKYREYRSKKIYS